MRTARTLPRRAAALLTALTLLCIACAGLADTEEEPAYVFCIRADDGHVIAAMDENSYIRWDPSWLDTGDCPADGALSRTVTSMKRDAALSALGKLTFIPPEYLETYTGGRQGVFAQLDAGMLIFAVSGSDQAVIVPEEYNSGDPDGGQWLMQCYAWLGSALSLAYNLRADAAVGQTRGDEWYEYDINEQLFYMVIFAQLGGGPVWIDPSDGETTDTETFIRWFLAQSTVRRFTLSAETVADHPLGSLTEGRRVLVVHDGEEGVNRIIAPTEGGYFVLTVIGGFSDDGLGYGETDMLAGYVHAILRLNGYGPEACEVVQILMPDSGSLVVMENRQTEEVRDRLINAWLDFAVKNERQILGLDEGS